MVDESFTTTDDGSRRTERIHFTDNRLHKSPEPKMAAILAEAVIHVLLRRAFLFSGEADLQAGIAAALSVAGREERLCGILKSSGVRSTDALIGRPSWD
jgi:hypothetical protein